MSLLNQSIKSPKATNRTNQSATLPNRSAISRQTNLLSRGLGNQAMENFLQAKSLPISQTGTKIQRTCASCTTGQGQCPKCEEEQNRFGTADSLLQRQTEAPQEEEEEKNIQTKSNSETSVPLIQRQPEDEEEIQLKPENLNIQTKLIIGAPNDKYELEADRVASQVVQRIEAPTVTGKMANSNTLSPKPLNISRVGQTGPLQRQEETEEENDFSEKEEDIQAKFMARPGAPPDDSPVQRKGEGSQRSAGATIESRLNGSKGGGVALPETLQTSMGQAFGRDLSSVRIHTADFAVNMNEALGAQAFTHGSDIYFNRGKYNPESTTGKQLLAHELTHTIQQTGAIQMKLDCWSNEWFDAIEKLSGGKRWGDTKEEKEAIRKRVRAQPDANKIKIKELINMCIRQGGDFQIEETKENISFFGKAKINAHQKMVQKLCDRGIKRVRDFRRNPANAGAIKKRAIEFDKREQLLLIIKQAMNTELFAADDIDSTLGGKDSLLTKDAKDLGDTMKTINIASMDLLIYLYNLANTHGFTGFAYGVNAWSVYSGYFSFTAGDLNTKTQNQPKGSGVPGGSTGTSTKPGAVPSGSLTKTPASGTGTSSPPAEVPIPFQEDFIKMQKFLRELEKSDLPGEHADPEVVSRLIKDFTDEDIKEFKKFYKEFLQKSEDEGGLALDKALELFTKLSELDRSILRTKRTLKEEGELITDPSKARIKLTVEKTDEANKELAKINEELAKVQRVAKGDPKRKKEFAPLDNSLVLFLNEMSILEGLIDGAGRKSTDIKDAASGLWQELDKFRNNLITEMQWIAAQLAIEAVAGAVLTYISGGTLGPVMAGRVASLVLKLNKLRKLISRALKVIAIVDTITSVVDTVSKAGQAYESFRKEFKEALRRVKAIEERLQSLDADEALDEEFETLKEQLMEKIQTQLDGQMGEILQHFFIPADATEDQLMAILMDIPEGLDLLKQVHARYKKGKGKAGAGEFANLLYVMSVEAGVKLYPLVGFLTAKAGETLNTLNAELEGKSTLDRMQGGLERLVTKSRKHRAKKPGERKKGIRGLFAKLRPKRYDYNQADIKKVLGKGETWMNTAFDEMNKGKDSSESFNGFWTKALFRFTVRKKVKELNAVRSSFGDVRATLKGKKTKGAPAAKKEKKVTPPRFKVKWSSMFSRKNNFYFHLVLNPTSGKIPKKLAKPLTYTSFRGKGILFSSKSASKKKSLRKWLDNEGYQITKNVKGKSLIRHSSTGKGPQGKTWYLQVDHDGATPRVKQDRKLTITQKYVPDFYGRLVNTNLDLPEGYVLYSYKGSEGIRARKGIAWLVRKFPLGIDKDGKIVGENKKFPIVETRTEKKAENYESIVDPESIADKMFEADKKKPKVVYNAKKRTYLWWKNHIRGRKELHQRPIFKHYILGNVKYARSVGDLLSGRHIPELKNGDDKGHLVAKRFGGSDDYDNLIPMKSSLNRSNQKGSWYRVEGDMAKEFRRGRKKVEIKINIHYPSTKSRRPHRFSGSFDVLKFNPTSKAWDKERSGTFPKNLKQ